MLVVVKDGDFHALAQFFFDVKTFRRLDVFQIDAAQRGFERGDDVDEFVRIVLVQFNVEDIDVGEFFEQTPLAFHHRLGRQRANVAQPQHCRAVGDHGDQIAARGHFVGLLRVGDNQVARSGHARRIGQRQVALVGQAFGGDDGDFSARRLAVIFQCGGDEILIILGAFLAHCGIPFSL